MQLGRTAALIARLREHLEATGLTQVALSKELGLSPQNTSLILRGTNCPNSETTLQIALEILRTNPMNDEPKTLHLAKERISELNQEIKQLKSLTGRAATPAPATPPPTGVKPTTTTTAWEKELERAAKERSAGLSSLPLGEQTLDELRIALNVETDSDRRTQIFKLIQLRKEENSLSGRRIRGA